MKTVLITGAAGNLGKACVEKFLSEGYAVVATVTPGRTLGFNTTSPVETYDADLTDEQAVEKVVAAVIAKYKRIDAALMLVGGYAPGSFLETNGSTVKKMLALNFETAYHVSRPVFDQMMKQPNGGRLIFIGARPAFVNGDGKKSLAYALSKSLVIKLAELLNATAKGTNVTASVVVPSTIDTPQNRAAMPDADFNAWVAPEAIASTIAHLCSDEASVWREAVVKVYGNA